VEASIFLCCFCGHEIERTKIDPCGVHVTTAEGKDQLWFCHAECFHRALTTESEVAALLQPVHF